MKDILAVIGIVACIAVSLITGISLSIGFLAAIVLCSILQFGNYRFKTAVVSMWHAVVEVKLLYCVIVLIGASVSSWLAGGVVQTIMVFGLKAMLGKNVVLMTFIITAVAGFFMGTAIGTISTLGIAILGIGAAFGIPLPILLGAAVSGAFISDKISPLSGLMNLTLAGSGATYANAVKSMVKTLVPVMVLSAVFYYLVGNQFVSADSSQVADIEEAMRGAFFIHPGLLLLPVMVVVLAFSGRPSIFSIGSGVVLGIVFAVVFQHGTLIETISAVFWGFQAHTGDALLDGILKSGGMVGMLEVILIVMCAVALSDFLEQTGMNKRIFGTYFDRVRSGSGLLMTGGLISIILTALTCDQTAGIVLPLKMLRKHGGKFGITPAMTARTISDTGTIIAPLMPWNINALIIIGITGISATAYGPYAILCILAPAISILHLFLSSKHQLKHIKNAA